MSNAQQLERMPERESAPHVPAVVTPMEMISRALTSGANIDVMEKLMGLQERWEANQGRKAFDAAIALAKGEIPPIFRNREVDFSSHKGRTNYRHEDLAGIARVIDPILQKHGLSYRYRSQQNGAKLRVTCILSHKDGYSEETFLEAGEDHSGNKNSIQAIGSAATYLQRYTLKLALGLSTSNDDDGAATGDADDEGRTGAITQEQFEEIRRQIVDLAADIPSFCSYMKVDAIRDIPQSEYDRALTALDAKRRRGAAR